MKKILAGVPAIYENKSENYMFCSCMNSLMRYLKKDSDYDFTFFAAVTGDAFCQLSLPYPDFGFTDSLTNRQMCSCESITRAFDACGYGMAGVETQILMSDKRLWKREIVSSINRNMPVLSFGIVGPETCSIITGYDEDGDVLYGHAQFGDWEPENVCSFDECSEKERYFKKRNGIDYSLALIFIGAEKKKPLMSDIWRDVFENIYYWAHMLPDDHGKGNRRVFGVRAFYDWSEALRNDEIFSDPLCLPDRQDAHTGMLCIAATNLFYVPEILDRIKYYCPDLTSKIFEMKAIHSEQEAVCRKIFSIQDGFFIKPLLLGKREIRLKLSESIRELGRLQSLFADISGPF